MQSELKIKGTNWNLSSLETNDATKQRAEWREKTHVFVLKWRENRQYLTDAMTLKLALDEYELWQKNYGLVSDELYFLWLKAAQDQTDKEIKARFNQVEEISKALENEVRFFELSLAQVSIEKQREFLASPLLASYKHFLEKIFKNAKYLLSEKEEKILALKEKSSHSSWIEMVSEFLSKEEGEILDEDGVWRKKSFPEIFSLMSSKKKAVRDAAAEVINLILLKHSDIAEAEINAILHDKKINDELRGYGRADTARHIADDIESEVVDSMLASVRAHFEIAQRYYRLKAALLGQKKLAYHERNVEIGAIDKTYSYEESLNLVHRVLQNLHARFGDIVRHFAEGGQIDVYPHKGKSDGAFCVHFLKRQPVYILLNHTNKLRDVMTLAHEIGHGINDELMKAKQNALNFDTTLSTAEVASTFMEDFVLQELLTNADEDLALSLAMAKLNDDISTIFRQVACYLFEQELHSEFRKSGFVSKEIIGQLFQKHMAAYMGDAVEQSAGSENWWVYWGHIRRFFYNYSYASGLLLSKALQRNVKTDKQFIEKVITFLSCGTSQSPADIFMDLGIDISRKSFWEEGITEIEELLEHTEALAKKLGKI